MCIKILLLFLLQSTFVLYSQSIQKQVIGTTGGHSSTPTVQLDQTVGEVAVNTIDTSGVFYLTEGYQQASSSPTTSIKDKKIEVHYKLYPNPTSNELNIDFSTEYNGNIALEIYDNSGKKIRSKNVVLSISKHQKIDVSNLSRGNYLIKLFNTKNQLIKTLKFIKI